MLPTIYLSLTNLQVTVRYCSALHLSAPLLVEGRTEGGRVANRKQRFVLIIGLGLMIAIAGATLHVWAHNEGNTTQSTPSTQSTRSSPIAVSSDDNFVWSVNPDNDSVSVFRIQNDANQKVAEIQVGDEPWCVALTPDGSRAYVTNMASGTVSVIDA